MDGIGDELEVMVGGKERQTVWWVHARSVVVVIRSSSRGQYIRHKAARLLSPIGYLGAQKVEALSITIRRYIDPNNCSASHVCMECPGDYREKVGRISSILIIQRQNSTRGKIQIKRPFFYEPHTILKLSRGRPRIILEPSSIKNLGDFFFLVPPIRPI